MKKLMQFHRYLSCFLAPAMLFFAVSGAWQAFRFQETRKDGSYVAPVVLEELSYLHKAERLRGPGAGLFRFGQLLLAVAFASSAIAGLMMAARTSRPSWLPWALVAAGVVLPALLSWSARVGGAPPPAAAPPASAPAR